jgi:hypothetical protein
MTQPDTARPTTARDVLAALIESAMHTRNGTLAWLTGLGNAVLNRPASMTLDDLRNDLMAQNAGVMPDGASKGNLSKAATAYRVLVRDGGLDPHILCDYRQRDLYAAAIAVEAGNLSLDRVYLVLQHGALDQYRADDEKPARKRNESTFDEPTPDDEQLPELMRNVYAAALVGADAAGMDVLDWVRQQAALAMVS